MWQSDFDKDSLKNFFAIVSLPKKHCSSEQSFIQMNTSCNITKISQ